MDNLIIQLPAEAIIVCAQVLLWRPAEILNGRMAMIGIVAGLAAQLRTGASVWQQQYYAPYAYLAAYILVVIGAVLNKCAPAAWDCILWQSQ